MGKSSFFLVDRSLGKYSFCNLAKVELSALISNQVFDRHVLGELHKLAVQHGNLQLHERAIVTLLALSGMSPSIH